MTIKPLEADNLALLNHTSEKKLQDQPEYDINHLTKSKYADSCALIGCLLWGTCGLVCTRCTIHIDNNI